MNRQSKFVPSGDALPKHDAKSQRLQLELLAVALDRRAARAQGPLDPNTGHLIQLAAPTASHSERAVQRTAG